MYCGGYCKKSKDEEESIDNEKASKIRKLLAARDHWREIIDAKKLS